MNDKLKHRVSSPETSTLKPYTDTFLKDNTQAVTPAEAWHLGTNIRTAHRLYPPMIRGWVMSEVSRLCKEISAKTTISNDEELIFCVRSIFEEHPTLKLEEIRACFDMVRKGKFGKLYERLKTPEILEFLRRYEGEIRTEIMERDAHQMRVQWNEKMKASIADTAVEDVLRNVKVEPAKQVEGHGVGSRLRKKLDEWERNKS
tara:strand:- start:15 stop:620 length:606 start_codon:yes stop_codon:yes gene_type:complete